MSDDPWRTGFSGVARLFPLPNLVLFPGVMQPLHIFEPRYRQMTSDALATDRLIALVLLQAGWEANYEGRPAIHSIACLGRIEAEQPLDDGRFNLLLRGLARIGIVEEVPHDRLYRLARVQLIEEVPIVNPADADQLRQRLQELMELWFSDQAQLLEQFYRLFSSGMSLGDLADILSFALPLPVETKQELLAERELKRRVRRLLHVARPAISPKPAPGQGKFPPEFSLN